MKRIDILTNKYLESYLKQNGNERHAYSSGGHPPHIYFYDDENHELRKLSITVPKAFVKKNGCVSISRIKHLLRAKIRERVAGSLGYSCGITVSGRWEIFFKRDTPMYFSRDFKRDLKNLFTGEVTS